MLMHLQPFLIEENPSTEGQRVNEVPDFIQLEPKRPRIEVNGLSFAENRSLVTTNSNKLTGHAFKNCYRWRSEHLIAFPWLNYDIEHGIASCQFARCKMYQRSISHILRRSKWKYPRFESRLFSQHEDTQVHQSQRCKHKGQIKLKVIPITDLSDVAIWTRIQAAWWLAKEDVAITKFRSLLEAELVNQGLQPPKSY